MKTAVKKKQKHGKISTTGLHLHTSRRLWRWSWSVWPLSLPLVLCAGVLSGRSAARCPHLSSRASPLLLLLSPLLWILITAPPLFPRENAVSHQDIQSVAISETLCTVIKVTFMLCSMLKGSVHHVKTYSIDGLAPLGLKESWRIAMTMNASPTGRGNKRCLNEFLMDCCKMTVRALLMPCGIISPECQCF